MDWLLIIKEMLIGSGRIALLVSVIIIPLMLLLAVLKDSGILDRATLLIEPAMKRFGLSNKAAFPILAGLLLGIVYGSGVIISFAKDRTLTKRDLGLVLVFLGVCHGVIEDNVIFISLGASAWILIFSRFFMALLAAFAVSIFFHPKPEP